MGQLKGLYFSLDALLASMILMACATFVIGYIPSTPENRKPVGLDKLHASSMQKVSDWNASKDSDNTVLGYIHTKHHENPSEAGKVCSNYFNFSKSYALYLSNSTDREKVCGSYNPGESDVLAVEQTITPDIPLNSGFKGPSKSILVIKN
jgi:hypothetical protein